MIMTGIRTHLGDIRDFRNIFLKTLIFGTIALFEDGAELFGGFVGANDCVRDICYRTSFH